MNILIIPSWYKSKERPHYGSYFEEQARMLLSKNHKVWILFPNHVSSFKQILTYTKKNIEFTNDAGLPTIMSKTVSILPTRIGFFVNAIQIKYQAYQAFKKYSKIYGTPDIIHAHSGLWGGVVANYISDKIHKPYIVTEHLSTLITSTEFDKKPFYTFFKRSFQNASKVFCVSTGFNTKLANKYGLQQSETLHNIINPIFFTKTKPIQKSNQLNLIAIGGFESHKRFDIFIEAINILHQQQISVRAVLIGEGSLVDIIRKHIERLNLSDIITIEKTKNREEIANAISNSHILVSSSMYETFGMTIAEAHAVGRPTVAYNCDGPKDIINTKNGLLFYELTPEKLSEAILRIWSNYQQYNYNDISSECYSKFSEETIYNKLSKHYQQICLLS